MTKILALIFSLLLTIFPNSVSLLGAYQDVTYPGEEVVTERVIEAVKKGDVEAFEEMMSPYAHENVENLSEKIEVLINTIEGDVEKAYWYSGGTDSVKRDYDSYESYRTWSIKIETSKSNYKLNVSWVRANTDTPELVGLNALNLFDMEHNLLAEVHSI